MSEIWLSLVVPTRDRVKSAKWLAQRLEETAAQPDQVELIWVIDDNDLNSRSIVETVNGELGRQSGRSSLRQDVVTCPAGSNMGELNRAGAEFARGEWVMLLNDDVEPLTRNWDLALRRTVESLRDPYHLLMVNDLDFEHRLATFPMVSRKFIEMAGGICPPGLRRFRIDDHTHAIFRMLGRMSGELRIQYHPYVIFRHKNWGLTGQSRRDVMASDDQEYVRLQTQRLELCRRILESLNLKERMDFDLSSFRTAVPAHRKEARWSHHGVRMATLALALWSRCTGIGRRAWRSSLSSPRIETP